MIWMIVLLLIYETIIKLWIKFLKYQSQFGEYAQISYIPWVGDFYYLWSSTDKYKDALAIYRTRLQNNPTVKFIFSNIFNKVIIIIQDPDYYKEVLINHENYKKTNVLLHDKMTSKGILFSPPAKWKQQRSILGTPFMYNKLMARLPMINQVIDQAFKCQDKTHIVTFNTYITSIIVIKSFLGDGVEGIQLNGKELVNEIISIVNDFGLLQLRNPYVSLKMQVFGAKSWRILPSKPERDINTRIDNLMSVVEKIIKNKIENYKPKEDPNFIETYIQHYLEQKEDDACQITLEELCQLFISIFAAGSDTTAHVVSNCQYYLGEQQEIQEELREEIDRVMGKDRDINQDHLNQFVKLNAFINEVLRIRNPVIAPIMRIANKDHYIKDLKIDKGTFISIFNNAPCWNQNNFADPNKFDIQRWLSNQKQSDNNFVFIPFSAGGRNCIGQHMALIETRMILAKCLMNYRIRLDPKVQVSWPVKLLYSLDPDIGVLFEELK